MADLVREILIDASPETIFPLLTTVEGHLKWEGTEVEIDARPGGIYRVLVAGQFTGLGEFVEVVPNERVVFTFGWEMEGNPITPGSTRVAITLVPEGSKTLVRLEHSGLPDANAVVQHTEGWDHYLGRLAVVGAGGSVEPDAPHDGG
ncbi:MAG: SRPBCC domain-containing protein [Acidimicrobiales bacterium]